MDPPVRHHPFAPVIVAGDDRLPLRVREELAVVGIPVVCVCRRADSLAATGAAAAGTRVVVGDFGAPDIWEDAGLGEARAVGLFAEEDLANLTGALLVAETSPTATIVVRLFSTDLGSGIERLLGGRGTVLSETEVAAPAFVQAALSGNTGQRVTVSGRILEVEEVDADHPALIVPLCNADTPTDVLPSRDELGDRVLGLIDPHVRTGARGALPVNLTDSLAVGGAGGTAAQPRPRRRRSRLSRMHGALRLAPRRAFILLAVIAFVLATSTAVFTLGTHLQLIDGLYFTVTTMATVGYGDINLLDQADWLKAYDIGLMAVSAVLLGSFLALITDLLVTARIDRALGRFPRPRRDHVVVCGLGRAGSKVIAILHELDIPCIGIEQYEGAVGIPIARALEIPVVFGDARAPGMLDELRVKDARALMAMTNDDLANLQCALGAREHAPGLRVVLRCFDAGLAERLDHSIELDLTRSVSGLAAPAFTAALLGRTVAEPLPLSNVPLRVLETSLPAGSVHVGETVADLEARGDLRVLTAHGRWRPPPDYPINAGDTIAIVGTRDACDELLAVGDPV